MYEASGTRYDITNPTFAFVPKTLMNLLCSRRIHYILNPILAANCVPQQPPICKDEMLSEELLHVL